MRAYLDSKHPEWGWAYFCINCGIEFHNNTRLEECPFCGMSFPSISKGFRWQYRSDATFDRLARERREMGTQDPEPMLAILNINPTSMSPSFSKSQIDLVRNDPEKLKEYIAKLFNLEANILSLKNNLLELYVLRYKNKLEVQEVNERPLEEMARQIDADWEAYRHAQEQVKVHMEILEVFKTKKPTAIKLPEIPKPAEPKYETPGLFNRKKVIEQNEALKAKYKLALEEYAHKCEQRLKEMKEQNNAKQEKYQSELQLIEKLVQDAKANVVSLEVHPENYTPKAPVEVCPEKARQKIIASEIEQAETLLKKLCETRNELYATNIIFGKYRDMVALATFYEYLLSGRCTTLEGPNGAYNLYESEIRANLIISKLSDIEKSLNRIEQSQYMIYTQLTEMNATLSRMSITMSSAYSAISDIQANTKDMGEYMAKIEKNTNVIAHNTAVTAYYSKVNAELTDALGFMVALK